MHAPSFDNVPWADARERRVWIGGCDLLARRGVQESLKSVLRPPTGPLDFAFITPACVDEALHFAQKLRSRLEPDGQLWICYAATAAEVADGNDMSLDVEVLIDGMSTLGFFRAGPLHGELGLLACCFVKAGFSNT